MDEKELQDLQNPDNWESTDEDQRPPVKNPRAVVSVAFSREDFELVSETARKNGMKISEFIRNSAVDRATRQELRAIVFSVSGGVRTAYPLTPFRGSRIQYDLNPEKPQSYAHA